MDKKFWQGVLSGVLGTLLICMLVLGIGSLVFGGVTVVTGANTEALGENTSAVLSKMNSLRRYMNEYFMEEVDSDKLADGVYKGMFASLGDPYSCYYTKEEYDELMEESSGKYCGIGATITQDPENGKVYIVFSSDRHRYLIAEFGILVVFHGEAVSAEFIEIIYAFIDMKDRSRILPVFKDLFDRFDVSVVNMRIRNDMYKLTRFQSGDLREHDRKHAVLDYIPVVCCQHILGTLVEYGIQRVSADVECH